MYPPKVSTADVEAVIRSLSAGSRLPSGAAVRAALQSRYGSRGGVARIYRLLAETRKRSIPTSAAGSDSALQAELQAMRARAERAEERELAHQNRWALEIDQLRQKLLSLESVAHQARSDREANERLQQRLLAAERRASLLEERLIKLQP